MKNLEKEIAARMAASVERQKRLFLTFLLPTLVGIGSILYVVITDTTMSSFSLIFLISAGVLLAFCESMLGYYYYRSRKCYDDYKKYGKQKTPL